VAPFLHWAEFKSHGNSFYLKSALIKKKRGRTNVLAKKNFDFEVPKKFCPSFCGQIMQIRPFLELQRSNFCRTRNLINET
jgi:hypothetical protein